MQRSPDTKKIVHTQIIGFGPSGLGVILAADKTGKLKELLTQGLVLIDKRKKQSWDNLNYDILSNSDSEDFLIAIKSSPKFSNFVEFGLGKKINDLGSGAVNLMDVSKLFFNISNKALSILSNYKESKYIDDCEVDKIIINKDKTISTYNKLGIFIARSLNLIVATGSNEKNLFPNKIENIYTSSELLKKELDDLIQLSIDDGKKIQIYGGSHSAFSCAEYIIRNIKSISNGQIILSHRSKINIHYKNIDEALENNEEYAACAIDIQSKEINRFSGLRKNVKILYKNIIAGEEKRISLLFNPNSKVINNSIAIKAVGYNAISPVIFDFNDKELNLDRNSSRFILNRCRRLCSNKNPIGNVFGVGLGYGYSEGANETHENPAGINLFHGQDAIEIIKQLQSLPIEEKVL